MQAPGSACPAEHTDLPPPHPLTPFLPSHTYIIALTPLSGKCVVSAETWGEQEVAVGT